MFMLRSAHWHNYYQWSAITSVRSRSLCLLKKHKRKLRHSTKWKLRAWLTGNFSWSLSMSSSWKSIRMKTNSEWPSSSQNPSFSRLSVNSIEWIFLQFNPDCTRLYLIYLLYLQKSSKATPAMQLRRNCQDSHISPVRSQLRKGL